MVRVKNSTYMHVSRPPRRARCKPRPLMPAQTLPLSVQVRKRSKNRLSQAVPLPPVCRSGCACCAACLAVWPACAGRQHLVIFDICRKHPFDHRYLIRRGILNPSSIHISSKIFPLFPFPQPFLLLHTPQNCISKNNSEKPLTSSAKRRILCLVNPIQHEPSESGRAYQ